MSEKKFIISGIVNGLPAWVKKDNEHLVGTHDITEAFVGDEERAREMLAIVVKGSSYRKSGGEAYFVLEDITERRGNFTGKKFGF